MNNFQIGDMVRHKNDEVTKFGVGMIIGKQNHNYSYAIHWLEHDFTSKYVDGSKLNKVS